MNLLEQLKSISSDFSRLEEFPIEYSGEIVGWNCNSLSCKNQIIGGGTAEDRILSRTIAIAETFERLLIQKYCEDSELERKFKLNKFKSSAGFAIGFNRKMSLENAVFEAVERYVLQLWTDGAISLQEEDYALENKLSKTFSSRFDRIQFLRQSVNTDFESSNIKLSLVVCIAFKGDGIFWGSKVHYNESRCIQHSLIEAYRNLNIFNYLSRSIVSERTYVDDVIFHFGSGAGSLKGVSTTNESQPIFSVNDFELIQTSTIFDQMFLSRAIVNGYSERYSENYKMRFW